MEQQSLKKQSKSDNWLYTQITLMIQMINSMDVLIQNNDLRTFIVNVTDFKNSKICSQILVFLQRSLKIQSLLFLSTFRDKVLKILVIQTLIGILILCNLLLLNLATNCLLEFQGNDIFKPILPICGIIFYVQLKLIYIQNQTTLSIYIIDIDLDQIIEIDYTIRYTWEAIFLITGCLAFLYQLDSHAGSIVVVTMISGSFFNLLLTIVMMKSENKVLEYKDLRVDATTDIIEGMKQIKYLSWEEIFSKKIMSQIRILSAWMRPLQIWIEKQLLHDSLFKFAENRTLLVITHRLENIKIYDKIIVMKQGEIVEQGNYQELIKIEGGFFNKLMSHHQQQVVKM